MKYVPSLGSPHRLLMMTLLQQVYTAFHAGVAVLTSSQEPQVTHVDHSHHQ